MANRSPQDLLVYFLAGLGLGMGMGLSVGIMLAPDSGERTRRKMFKRAERMKDNLSERISPN